MRLLAVLHRWWGVAFCLLFAMWFASGIVMHFVPFPARREQSFAGNLDRFGARREQIDYDQWTVAGDFDSDRPLTRIALDDAAGTEIYLSSASGRVVLVTTRTKRVLNYLGSVPHWLYLPGLRHHKHVWTELMWWLSLLATIGAALGAFLGLLRLRGGPACRGLRRWHHIYGLAVAPVVLGWIFSGFLSMNDLSLWPGSDDLFRAFHTLDFPPLASHSWLHTGAIVVLCLSGLAFSLSGVALAWRVLRTTREDATAHRSSVASR